MAITINGSGTITGVSAGGLPDGSITADDLASTLDISGKTVTLPSDVGGITTGKVLQVVERTFTTYSSTTSTSYQNTDAYVDITPSSTSSKILIIGSMIGQSNWTGVSAFFRLHRDSTATAHIQRWEDALLFNVGVCDLDSPSTTSSVRYMVKIKTQSGNPVGINVGNENGNLIALEIEG